MAKTNQTEGAPVVEQTLNTQEAFIIKYKKVVIIAVVAILAIVAGTIAFKNFYSGPREDKASTAIAKAQEMFANGDYEKALKGDKGAEGFLAVEANYSGTDAANLAKLYAGLCYAHLGKATEAVKYLDDFSTRSDAMISPNSQAALGNAYAQAGQIDKAIDALKKAAKMADSESIDDANNSISPAALLQAGRLLESQNKKEEALKIYEEVKAKYVNSAASQDIDKYIERVK